MHAKRELTAAAVFEDVSYTPLRGATADLQVSAIEFSSRDVAPGALFFCVVGTASDGHKYAADAVERGASALVVQRELDCDVPQFLVADSRKALAQCSANFYGRPSERLSLVGVTGTNGKTTTTFLVEHIVRFCGKKAGLMGTVECHVGDKVRPSLHTTPESRDLQLLLADMLDAGVEVAALEVSSHALDLGRIEATRIDVAAFTNLTQDHLDYHETMENYYSAKLRLFEQHEPRAAVVCIDDEYGARLAKRCEGLGCELICVSANGDARADVRVTGAQFAPHGTIIDLEARGEAHRIDAPLVGKFNVENISVAFGIGLALGFGAEQICDALAKAPQVPGRLQRVIGAAGTKPDFGVLVDYAHTPDSVAKAIGAVKAVTSGRVICVFGCGGDRDATKRPLMGKAALTADYAIVTSDNPRTEDPNAIIEQIVAGMKGHEERFEVEPDRATAIAAALRRAHAGDAVLVAGKGHEDYQIVGTVKHHFDDREVCAQEIEQL